MMDYQPDPPKWITVITNMLYSIHLFISGFFPKPPAMIVDLGDMDEEAKDQWIHEFKELIYK